jgi:hypothetical protein
VIAGAANETAAMPSAVRQTIQDPRVSIVAGAGAVEMVAEETVIWIRGGV